jgi:hypothetical protein
MPFIRKAGPTNGKTCLKPTTGRTLAARHQFRPAKELADTLSPQLSHDERARIDARIKKWKRVVS